ncbi:hypothetical protein ACFFUO_17080 [Vibrio artabrorum]|nr:hypothetical protein [Vibrio artabrorum]
MTIHREIIFSSDSVDEVNKKETELIRQYNSNNPDIKYNRCPKYKR